MRAGVHDSVPWQLSQGSCVMMWAAGMPLA
jgi:hypothetical protein